MKREFDTSARILVVGMTAAGAESLPVVLRERILGADVLVGGVRHLGYFSSFGGVTVPIQADLRPVVDQLRAALEAGRRTVVLASGDPLCYGIGASLRRFFPAEALEIIPAPSAFQLAFAALAEPWDDAALLSAHARPLAEVVLRTLTAAKAAILTDHQQTPAAIARALLKAGLSAETPCAVCESLGGPEQRIVRANLGRVTDETFAPLNVFVIWPAKAPSIATSRQEDQGASGQQATAEEQQTLDIPQSTICNLQFAIPPGLPDEAFATQGGQITKREVRLLSLAELALGPGEVLWDIGAGSGSIAIEAARAQPAAAVFAVERRTVMYQYARENLRRFPAPNLTLVEGIAPQACATWPDPDAVFVGGTGGELEAIVTLAQQRLRSDGRLVINLATLEHLAEARKLLPAARVVQVQISRATPILDMTRLEALNPVFVITWRAGAVMEPTELEEP